MNIASKRSGLALTLAFLLAFTLSSCSNSLSDDQQSEASNSEESANTPESTESEERILVSEAEFRAAVNKAELFRDEFKGNYELGSKVGLDKFTKEGTTIFYINLYFTKEDDSSPWETSLVSAYYGEDWIFHDEVNIKSSAGILNLEEISEVGRDVTDGGKVSEISAATLDESTFRNYCKIINGTDVIFRLRGSEASDAMGNMTQANIESEKLLCIIGYGLAQGFKV
jgi:hypothetical protein